MGTRRPKASQVRPNAQEHDAYSLAEWIIIHRTSYGKSYSPPVISTWHSSLSLVLTLNLLYFLFVQELGIGIPEMPSWVLTYAEVSFSLEEFRAVLACDVISSSKTAFSVNQKLQCKLRSVPCLPTRHSSNTNTTEYSEPSTKDQTICNSVYQGMKQRQSNEN